MSTVLSAISAKTITLTPADQHTLSGNGFRPFVRFKGEKRIVFYARLSEDGRATKVYCEDGLIVVEVLSPKRDVSLCKLRQVSSLESVSSLLRRAMAVTL